MDSTTSPAPPATAPAAAPLRTYPAARPGATLSVRRTNVMRLGYLIMGGGLAATKWPLLIGRSEPWPLYGGVSTYILVAMGLLALVGLRYPVKMLPVLLLESAWKLLWLGAVALPLWARGDMDAATAEVAGSVLWVAVVLAVVPWRYVYAQYVRKAGEPWRSSAAAPAPGRG